jgi:hypothetical protein
MKHIHWIIKLMLIASLQLSAAACAKAPTGPTKKIEPAQVKLIEGTDLHQVILTPEAAKRTDIQTVPVREEQVVRKRLVRGEVMAVPETHAARFDALWVRLPLIESDLKKVDRSQPILVLPLVGEDRSAGLTGQLVQQPPVDTAPTLYYEVERAKDSLLPGQQVRVELSLLNNGNGATHMIVPYAAVIYDVQGELWVYTSPAPLTFVRHPIQVEYIEGDQAILLEGPAIGTPVVTVGAAELFGLEFGIGH